MGKDTSTPPPPDYTKAAIATSNLGKYNEQGPTGGVTWKLRPGADPKNPQPGDYIRTTSLSGGEQSLYNKDVASRLLASGLIGGQARQLGAPDSSLLRDALYKRATQYYDRNFDRQAGDLRSQLLNSGLAEGSEAYKRSMDEFNQRRDTAYSGAADTATIGAEQQYQSNQNNAVARLAQLLAASRGQTPTSQNVAAGPDLLGAANQQYQGQIAAQNASNAAQAQQMQQAMTAGMGAYLLLSDRRLKSNITRVGTGFADLPVYEYDIFDRRERGYMAQEVQATFPHAVQKSPEGWLMVDYAQLGGRP